jgi:hypothetical protein
MRGRWRLSFLTRRWSCGFKLLLQDEKIDVTIIDVKMVNTIMVDTMVIDDTTVDEH